MIQYSNVSQIITIHSPCIHSYNQYFEGFQSNKLQIYFKFEDCCSKNCIKPAKRDEKFNRIEHIILPRILYKTISNHVYDNDMQSVPMILRQILNLVSYCSSQLYPK